ncbi:MAG: PEP-CTERM sorting domain-containing protein [Pseudomonadota bacterium]
MKFVRALAALAALTVGATANATLLIDGFGDTNVGGTADDMTPVIMYSDLVTDTDIAGVVNRTITTESLNGGDVTSDVDSFGGNPNTFFQHSQDVLTLGTSLIEWDFAPNAGPLGAPITISVEVISADLPGATISFSLFDGVDTLTESLVLPAVNGGAQNFTFTFFDAMDVLDENNIVGASLFIDGSMVEALDVAIDFVAVPMPEPSALALVGLGLFGLSFAARRRRAA